MTETNLMNQVFILTSEVGRIGSKVDSIDGNIADLKDAFRNFSDEQEQRYGMLAKQTASNRNAISKVKSSSLKEKGFIAGFSAAIGMLVSHVPSLLGFIR